MRLRRCILAGALAIATRAGLHVDALAAEPAALVIGSLSDNLTRETKRYQSLVNYLTDNLATPDKAVVRLHVVATVDAMVAGLRSGTIDLYIDSPFIVAEVGRRVPIVPALRRWKGGVAEYHTLFFGRADAGVATIADLQGRVVAFDSPYSTSGYLLPKAMLLQQGFVPVEVDRADAAVDPQQIGYVFSSDDANSLLWVLKGKVAAGVTDPAHYTELADKRPGDLMVIARSLDVPRHVAAYRADLDPDLRQRLLTVLTAMDDNPAGQDALQAFEKTTRFDALPEATATFAKIEAMLDLLHRPTP